MATNFDIDLNNNQDNFDIDLNDQVESFVVEFGEITWVTNNDFNKLKNRPSYAGETMTGDTNIPVVPTATSQLTNDANFQNANDLSNAISAHNQSSSAHQDIRQAITDEANIRSNADNGLQSQIDAITSASDVVDIVGTYAELQAYDTQHLKDNDVIKVLQDETHNDAMTYWRWSTHTNTWTYIGAEGPYYTKSETNTLLDEKLDVDEVPDGFFDGPATITPAQGTSVELEKGLKLKSVELLGDTTQQTYTGKNIINNSNLSYLYTNADPTAITLTTLSTGIGFAYSKSGTPVIIFKIMDLTGHEGQTVRMSATFGSGGRIRIAYINADASVRNLGASTTVSDELISWVVPNDLGDEHYLAFYLNSVANSSVDYTNLIMTINNSNMNYEPYVGGIPAPNPDYPQDVNVVTGTQTVKLQGKNLWSFASSYTNTTTTNSWVLSDTAITIPSGNYVFSCNAENTNNVQFTWKYADNVSHSSIFTNGKTAVTFTEDVAKVAIRMQGPNSISNIQLEAGSTPTTYEPYQSQSYTVDLGSTELCKIGDYQDYIYKSGDDWYVHKETGGVTYTGGASENWDLYSSGTSVFRIRILDMKGQDNQQRIAPMFCNYYIPIAYGEIINPSYWPDYGIAGRVTSSSGIAIRNKDCADVTAFKTWLSTHNTTVYYPIATPTDTKITNSVLIGQLDAVLDAVLYSPITYLVNSGNLPAILKLEAFTGNLNSLLEIASEPDNKVFVGTDGNVAGKSGFVPAPKTTDDDKYLKSDGTWATVSGGSSVNVVQTVGNSQTDVMSQRAVTSMVFKDPATRYQTLISGGSSDISGIGSVALGYGAQAYGQQAIAIASGIADASRAISIGGHANNSQGAKAQGSIALGYGATTTQVGEMNIGSSDTSYGYATSNYRLISGVYDGQNAHDAVTVGQINDTIDAINTALSTNIPHIGAST